MAACVKYCKDWRNFIFLKANFWSNTSRMQSKQSAKAGQGENATKDGETVKLIDEMDEFELDLFSLYQPSYRWVGRSVITMKAN